MPIKKLFALMVVAVALGVGAAVLVKHYVFGVAFTPPAPTPDEAAPAAGVADALVPSVAKVLPMAEEKAKPMLAPVESVWATGYARRGGHVLVQLSDGSVLSDLDNEKGKPPRLQRVTPYYVDFDGMRSWYRAAPDSPVAIASLQGDVTGLKEKLDALGQRVAQGEKRTAEHGSGDGASSASSASPAVLGGAGTAVVTASPPPFVRVLGQ